MRFRKLLAAILAAAMLMISACGTVPVFAEEEAPAATESKPAEAPKPDPPKEPDPPKPTEAPTPKPTEAPTPKPTEAPTPAPTEAPTAAPTEAPADKPSEEPTPGSEAQPTEAPQGTSVPAEGGEAEATQAPADPADPTATAEPGAEVTPEPSETPEPSATPAPAAQFMSFSASGSYAFCGKSASFSFFVRHAASLRYSLIGPSGSSVDSGTLSNGASSYSFTPGQAGRYTLELTAVSEDGSEVTTHCSITAVDAPELSVSVKAEQPSCHAGDAVSFKLKKTEGVELASCHIELKRNTTVFHETGKFEDRITVNAPDSGKVATITIVVTITDIYGRSASATTSIPCAVHDRETSKQWEATMKGVQKTGVWMDDLIAIARTQIGYRESSIDFGPKYDGGISGYTRYGDWYGLDYEEWCAMFACFCLNYAGIPDSSFPYAANGQRWIEALRPLGLYAERGGYEPQVGDLAFFDWENDDDCDHVGIIYEITRDGLGRVSGFKTIEGNSKGMSVTCDDYYSINDGNVVGFGLVNLAYDRKVVNEPRKLMAEGDGVKITADFDPEAKIPARAVLRVHEIERGDEAFEAQAARIAGKLAEEDDSVEMSFLRLFDVSFVDQDGAVIEPEAPVTLAVACDGAVRVGSGVKPGVVQINRAGGITLRRDAAMKRGNDGCTFQFEQSRFKSTIGVFLTGKLNYKAGSLKFNCPAYGVKVRYDREDGIPDGAALTANEITRNLIPYLKRLSQAGEAGKAGEGETLKLFEVDVTLNGMKVEPDGDVTIEITCPQEAGYVRVVRLADSTPMEATLKRSSDRAVVAFDTDAFSAFAVIFGE